MPDSLIDREPQILIVDDERENRELLEIVLRWERFVVLVASSGEEALAIIATQRPDLVLLDVMMPGMTGYEVLAKIRAGADTRHLPVIMVTALADADGRALASSAGADDFVAKPISRSSLLASVRAVLKAHRPAA